MTSEITREIYEDGTATEFSGGIISAINDGKSLYLQNIAEEVDTISSVGLWRLSSDHSNAVIVQDNVGMQNHITISINVEMPESIVNADITQGHEGRIASGRSAANLMMLSDAEQNTIKQLGETSDYLDVFGGAFCNSGFQGNGDDTLAINDGYNPIPEFSSYGNQFDGGHGNDTVEIPLEMAAYHLQDLGDNAFALVHTETGTRIGDFTNYENIRFGHSYDDVESVPLKKLREQGIIQPATDDEMIGSGVEGLPRNSCALQLS